MLFKKVIKRVAEMKNIPPENCTIVVPDNVIVSPDATIQSAISGNTTIRIICHQDYLGLRVENNFGEATYSGTVMEVNMELFDKQANELQQGPWFNIRYDDGDKEDISLEEMLKLRIIP